MEVLVTKTVRAAKRLRVGCVTASGGVTCNRALLREQLLACQHEGLYAAPGSETSCTDNAAMIGVLAEYKLRHGVAGDSLDAEIQPGMSLETV